MPSSPAELCPWAAGELSRPPKRANSGSRPAEGWPFLSYRTSSTEYLLLYPDETAPWFHAIVVRESNHAGTLARIDGLHGDLTAQKKLK